MSTLNSLGMQTITATDVNDSQATGTTTVDVNAGYTFSVSGFPSEVTAGAPEDITVTALTASGELISDYSGTVDLTSSDPAFLANNNPSLRSYQSQ